MPGRSSSGTAVEAPADTFTYTAATLSVAPGTYTLAELALAGYTPTAWTCTNGGGGAFDAGSVTLAAGDPTVTCTITNDDQPVGLVIVKRVVNDDGGSAVVGDFGITTSAGALVFGDRRRGARRHLHLHRRDALGRARHVHPGRPRAGRLHADRLDLHQRRRRRLSTRAA